MPDGETTERNWVKSQYAVLSTARGLEEGEPIRLGGYDDMYPQVRLTGEIPACELRFDPLGYASRALTSYPLFRRLKDQGLVPATCRFQVSLPTPLAAVSMFVPLADQPAVGPAYERRMLQEVDDLAANVPATELAVQWDTAVEFALLEGVWEHRFDDAVTAVVDRLARIGKHVPEDIDLGYHLCYGSRGNRHFVEPADTGMMVRVAQGIVDNVGRPLQFIQLPVPIDRCDDDYFRPLAQLRLSQETELYLGLVHLEDGVHGNRKRITAAQRFAPEFGVSAECGLGKRSPQSIPRWLGVHAELAEPVH